MVARHQEEGPVGCGSAPGRLQRRPSGSPRASFPKTPLRGALSLSPGERAAVQEDDQPYGRRGVPECLLIDGGGKAWAGVEGSGGEGREGAGPQRCWRRRRERARCPQACFGAVAARRAGGAPREVRAQESEMTSKCSGPTLAGSEVWGCGSVARTHAGRGRALHCVLGR